MIGGASGRTTAGKAAVSWRPVLRAASPGGSSGAGRPKDAPGSVGASSSRRSMGPLSAGDPKPPALCHEGATSKTSSKSPGTGGKGSPGEGAALSTFGWARGGTGKIAGGCNELTGGAGTCGRAGPGAGGTGATGTRASGRGGVGTADSACVRSLGRVAPLSATLAEGSCGGGGLAIRVVAGGTLWAGATGRPGGGPASFCSRARIWPSICRSPGLRRSAARN